MRKLLAIACMSVFLSGAAWGHGAWIEKRFGDLAVVYGHGAGDDAYDPRKVTEVSGYDKKGRAVPVKADRLNDHVRLHPGKVTAGVVGKFDNGYWSKDSDGRWHNKPKSALDGAVAGGRYVKYMVALLKESAHNTAVKGLPLEIVPQQDPLQLSMGDELTVAVYSDGQPVEGASVVADYVTNVGQQGLVTDADGKVTLTIRNDGLNVISTSLDKPVTDDPEADELGLVTTLSFGLTQGH